jgi:hypothetical protein
MMTELGERIAVLEALAALDGRVLHSSTFQLNLCQVWVLH